MGLGFLKQKRAGESQSHSPTKPSRHMASPYASTTMKSPYASTGSVSIIPELPMHQFEALERADYVTLEQAAKDPAAYAHLLKSEPYSRQLDVVQRRLEEAQSRAGAVYAKESSEITSSSDMLKVMQERYFILAKQTAEKRDLLAAKRVAATRILGQMASRNDADTTNLAKQLLYGEISVKDFTRQYIPQRVLMYERASKAGADRGV
ncbi:Modifier of rudimentary (Mod(r)) protein [Carpediemonas membranifera]|uniref:Modifier of rudimentary (Mod(R)) protein n=1 Tax=Carpediemonas membranifera TaxID=201153 RepID=A0A8J6APE9_9EUKA|nr:Modifier of rudimentary (Mod(r)) protein [Carpediemonas membranifera]|eukprot:KAG9389821.1 Modifier of rudimentary (Mod(r)) protein [Carpediemonas membranifera]